MVEDPRPVPVVKRRVNGVKGKWGIKGGEGASRSERVDALCLPRWGTRDKSGQVRTVEDPSLEEACGISGG